MVTLLKATYQPVAKINLFATFLSLLDCVQQSNKSLTAYTSRLRMLVTQRQAGDTALPELFVKMFFIRGLDDMRLLT